MEVQLTDFENAAFAVFIVLLSRAILHFNLNLYIPISKVTPAFSQGSTASDANMYHALTPVARWTRTWPGRSVATPCGPKSSTSARTSSPLRHRTRRAWRRPRRAPRSASTAGRSPSTGRTARRRSCGTASRSCRGPTTRTSRAACTTSTRR